MSHRHVDDTFDGEHEPDYVPEILASPRFTGVDSLRSTIGYEKFKVASWRSFRRHTGHWPLLSIVFHYGAIGLSCLGIAVFIWMTREREWSSLQRLAIGASAALIYVTGVVSGAAAARKRDWKVFGNRRNTDDE